MLSWEGLVESSQVCEASNETDRVKLYVTDIEILIIEPRLIP